MRFFEFKLPDADSAFAKELAEERRRWLVDKEESCEAGACFSAACFSAAFFACISRTRSAAEARTKEFAVDEILATADFREPELELIFLIEKGFDIYPK
jgi:hypothetical protein